MCWLNYLYYKSINAVLSRSLLYMGLSTMKPVFRVSDKASLISKSPQLQRLARVENCNFTFKTFKKENNEGADQSAQMHRLRLVCTFVVCKPEDRFSRVEAYIYISKIPMFCYLCQGFCLMGTFYGNIFLLCCANCVLFKHVNSGICVLKCYQICCKICPVWNTD